MYADLVIQICNIQLSISQKIPTIPPIQPSPLDCRGKMAISVCSITLHCLKQSQSLPKLPFSLPSVQKTKLHYTRWLLRRSYR